MLPEYPEISSSASQYGLEWYAYRAETKSSDRTPLVGLALTAWLHLIPSTKSGAAHQLTHVSPQPCACVSLLAYVVHSCLLMPILPTPEGNWRILDILKTASLPGPSWLHPLAESVSAGVSTSASSVGPGPLKVHGPALNLPLDLAM